MNKQLLKLAEQAGMNIVDDKFSTYGKFAEKFAELIVKECAGFRNELGIALCTDPGALHRYFGVEE